MNTETTHLSTTVPHDEAPSRRPGRPLSRLLCLSDRQLEHVNVWLKEKVPYRKIVELCRTEFQREIPHMSFVRYANRRELACELQLDELEDAKEAAAEFSKYAVTGDPTFSANTLALLEEQAFDLALAHHRDGDADDLSILEKLSALINKARNTRARERHATVQEQKLALRREELELKRQLATARLAKNQTGISEDHVSSPSFSVDAVCQPPSNHASATRPGTTHPRILSPNPLPPEIVEENRRYAEKLRTGKIIFDTSGPAIRDIELPDIPSRAPSVALSSAHREPSTQQSGNPLP